MKIVAGRFRCFQRAQHGVVFERQRGDGEFVELQPVTAGHRFRDEQQQRIEVHRHGRPALERGVQVVGEAARAGAEHEHVTQFGVIMQHGLDLFE